MNYQTHLGVNLNAVINGGTLTFEDVHIGMLMHVIAYFDLEQFTVVRGTGEKVDTWNISTPINGSATIKEQFAVQIHRANNENKLGKKLDIREDGPDTDPTPPGRGGGASVTEFVNTEAKAA